MANDSLIASQNFLNALHKIPSLVEKQQQGIQKGKEDIAMQEKALSNTVWNKEDKLVQLKTELHTLERKIQITLEEANKMEENQLQEENNFENETLQGIAFTEVLEKKQTSRTGYKNKIVAYLAGGCGESGDEDVKRKSPIQKNVLDFFFSLI